MKVLIVSRALIARAYRQKLAALAMQGMDVVAVVPESWRESRSVQRFESGDDSGYRVVVTGLRWNGHFHLHWYPDLPAIIRRERPDLVHLDEEPYNAATFLGALFARRASIPSVFFTWQNLYRRYPPPFSDMERAVYRWTDHALAGSEEARQILRLKGYQGKVTVTPQFGVDPVAFRPVPRAAGPFTVGFPNRLVAVKGPMVLLDAFSHLSSEARLVFAGDGPLRENLERSVASRGWGERVTFHARVASTHMPAMMRGFDAVVLPSLSAPGWREQFGRVLIEAMASGVPVVGSDSGEIPTVIGDAGMVVPEGDADALGASLRRLETNPGLRMELGQRGRTRVLERFTHAHVAAASRDAYRLAIEESRWRRGLRTRSSA